MEARLLGQAHVVRHLTGALQRGRLAHALLFLGPPGVGRETCARLLAGGVLCEQGEATRLEPLGCGHCRTCVRVAAGHHPDVHVVMPEAESVRRGLTKPDGKKKPSRSILVDQVRELSRVMRMRPYEGRARVAILVDAHTMNSNAANALLKTLEEPPPDSLLVLLAPHARSVLPTIASRCQRLIFAPLADDDVREVLTRLGASHIADRVQAAQGSVSQALSFDPDADPAGSDKVAGLLKGLWSAIDADRLDAAEQVGKDRSDAEQALDAMERLLFEQVRKQVARGPLASPPLVEGERQSLRDQLRALEDIAEARQALRENGAVQLVMEQLLLRFAAATRDAPSPRRGSA